MTTLKVTIDLFSGRENPVIELRGDEARDALKRLQPARKLTREDVGFPPEPTLGYRGLVIEQLEGASSALPKLFRLAHGDLLGPRLAHRAVDGAFEDYLLAESDSQA